jgi:predicted NBD/HSP70 family sugar kinase
MSRRLGGLPVHLDNDANLGALAEVTLGAGREARNALYVMISAGIGAGLIIDGRPYRGRRGMAGEIGHVLVDETGPICRCGNRGCLESYVSGPALAELLRSTRGAELTVTEIVRLAREGDAGCSRAIADAGRILGRVVAAICNIFNPEMVVIGGDLGEAGDLLLDPMREAVDRYAIAPAAADAKVVAGELGERAQVLGALALAILQSEHLAAHIAPPALSKGGGAR